MEPEFDELPLNNNNAFQVQEFAEEEEVLKEMSDPLHKRIGSKNWKIRLKTYEELQEVMGQDGRQGVLGEDMHTVPGHFVKMSQESNPNVLEKAVQTIAMYFAVLLPEDTKKDNIQLISYSSLLKNLVEKAVPGKPSLKKHGMECLVNLFDKVECRTTAMEVIHKLMAHKTAKLQQAALQALLELMENFGVEPLDHLKEFFPLVEKLSGSTNHHVKQESLSFYKQVFLWMGEPLLRTQTKHLKKNQQEELDIFIKENQDVHQVAKMNKSPEKSGPTPRIDVDPYDLADPVDLSSTFNDKWCNQLAALPKWSSRKDLMLQLADRLEKSVKVLPSCGASLGSFLRKQFIKESNVNVIQSCVKVAGLMAKAIRKGFKAQAKLILPFLLDKLGDKKVSLQEESQQALQAMCLSLELLDVAEPLNKALESKNSTQLNNILLFLLTFHSNNQDSPPKIKSNFSLIAKSIGKLQENPKKEVRESAAKLYQLIALQEDHEPAEPTTPRKQGPDAEKLSSTLKKQSSNKNIALQKSGSKKKISISIDEYSAPIQAEPRKKEDPLRKSLKVPNKQSGDKIEQRKEINLPSAIKLMKESNWEKRRLGLDQTREFILEGKSASNGVLNELLKTFTSRIMDPHKQLQKQFIQSTGLICKAAECHVKQYSKNIIINLVSILGDKNKELRELGLEQLNELGGLLGYEPLVALLSSYLGTESNFVKENVLDILTRHCQLFPLNYLKNVFVLCNDKNKTVRQKAESLVVRLVQQNVLTTHQMQVSTRDLKREHRKVIEKFLSEESRDQVPPSNILHDLNDPRTSKELSPQDMVANYTSNQSEEQPQQESIIQLQQEKEAQLMKNQRVNLEGRQIQLQVDELFVEQLQCQMQAIINEKYLGQLFSLEFKGIIELCERVIVSCIEESHYIYLVSDLLLKWVLLVLALKSDATQKARIMDKALEIVKYLLILFRENDYYFVPLEVQVINTILQIYIRVDPPKHTKHAVQMFALMLDNSESPGPALQFLLDSLRESSMVAYVQEVFSTQSVLAKAEELVPRLPNYPTLRNHDPLVQALLFTGQYSEIQLSQFGFDLLLEENQSDALENNSGLYSSNKNKLSQSRILKGGGTPRQGMSQTPSQVLSQSRPPELLQSFVKVNKNFMVEERLEDSHLQNVIKIFKYEDLKANLEDVVDSLMQLNDLALSDFPQHSQVLLRHASLVVSHFIMLLKNLFLHRQHVQSHLVHYSFTVFHKLLVLKRILKGSTQQELSSLFTNLATLLAQEEEFKVGVNQRNDKKEWRNKMSLGNKSMSHPSDHSSASQQEHFSRSLAHLVMTVLRLAPMNISPIALVDSLMIPDLPTLPRLLLLKMLFKFNRKYHSSINYPELLLALDRYLYADLPGQSLILLMARNIINHFPPMDSLQSSFKSQIHFMVKARSTSASSAEPAPDLSPLVSAVLQDPCNTTLMIDLFKALQNTPANSNFLSLLDQNKSTLLKEYVLEQLRNLYEQYKTLQEPEPDQPITHKGAHTLLTKNLLFKLEHYRPQAMDIIHSDEQLIQYEQSIHDDQSIQHSSERELHSSINGITQELKQIRTEEDQQYANLLDSDFQHQLDDQYQNLLEGEESQELF